MSTASFKAAAMAFVLTASGGCLAAAGAGLGAGIYMSDRGAESLVEASIDRTHEAAREVFTEMSITEEQVSTEQSGSNQQRTLKGKLGEKTVEVELRSEGESTRIEVVASKDRVIWDKDLARDVLERIVKASN
jgi:hypothetical protein